MKKKLPLVTKNMKFHSKKILIAIFTGLLLLILVSILILKYIQKPHFTVNELRISNVTDTSATISWITNKAVTGSVLYSDQNTWFPLFNQLGKERAYDDRDTQEIAPGNYEVQKQGTYYLHHVTLRDLKPDTHYFYKIRSGLQTVDIGYFDLHTASIANNVLVPKPVYGNVFVDDTTNNELLLYLRIQGNTHEFSQVVSTIVNAGEGWNVDIGNIRSKDLENQFVSEDKRIFIDVFSKDEKIENWEINPNRLQPVDDIILLNKSTGTEDLKGNGNTISSLHSKSFIATVHAQDDQCICGQPEGSGYYCDNGMLRRPTGERADFDKWCSPKGWEQDKNLIQAENACPNCPEGEDTILCANAQCISWQGSDSNEHVSSTDNFKNEASCFGTPLEEYKPYTCKSGILHNNEGVSAFQCWCGDFTNESQTETTCPYVKELESANCGGKPLCKCSKENVQEGVLTKTKSYEFPGCTVSSHSYHFTYNLKDYCTNPSNMRKVEMGNNTFCRLAAMSWNQDTGEWDIEAWPEYIYSNACPGNVDSECRFTNNANSVVRCEEITESSDGANYTNVNFTWLSDVDYDIWHYHPTEITLNISITSDGKTHYSNTYLLKDVTIFDEELIKNNITTITANYGDTVSYSWEVISPKNFNCEATGGRGEISPGVTKIDLGTIRCRMKVQDLPEQQPPPEETTSDSGTEDDAGNTVDVGTVDTSWIEEFNSKGTFKIDAEALPEEEKMKEFLDELQQWLLNHPYFNRNTNHVTFSFEDMSDITVCGRDDAHACISPSTDPLRGYIDDDLLTNLLLENTDTAARNFFKQVILHELVHVFDLKLRDENFNVRENIYKSLGWDRKLNEDEGLMCYRWGFKHDSEYERFVNMKVNGCAEEDLTYAFEEYYLVALKPDIFSDGANLKDHPVRCRIIRDIIFNREFLLDGIDCNEFVSDGIDYPILHISDFEHQYLAEDGLTWISSDLTEDAFEAEDDLRVLGVANNDLIVDTYANLAIQNPVNDYISSIHVDSNGVYEVTINKDSPAIATVDRHEKENRRIYFFADSNSNGKKDIGETISVKKDTVQVHKVNDIVNYRLHQGWNLLSFPIINEVNTSTALIDYLNNCGAYVTHIAEYTNGNWHIYTQRNESVYADGFSITSNTGYFVKNHAPAFCSIRGDRNDYVYLDLQKGWNLVGLSKEDYTAKSLLDLLGNNDIDASIISSWENNNYASFVKDSGNYYGDDFSIFLNAGYFIKVDANGGVFEH